MKISLCVPIENMQTANGFGQASYQIVRSLQRLGHTVKLHDPTAPVELAFSQPTFWQWSSKTAYHIGYVPWESTELPRVWKYMLRSADELWTTSPLISTWFGNHGFPAKVYQHGVDSKVWTRHDRAGREGPVRFLHIGEPALRKGGPLVLETFTEEFGNSAAASLTIKSHGATELRSELDNVTIIQREYSEEEMVKLVHDHDILVYPSYGEGFGLIPLQAMSTGMPVIITDGWAPYQHLVPSELIVRTYMAPSPWPKVHPGEMFHPVQYDLADAMQHAFRDFDHYNNGSYMRAIDVHEEYDWDRLTAEAFAPIFEKFDS